MNNMSTTAQTMQHASPELIRKGWEILVQQLGVSQATRFVVALERGEGDTIIDVEKYWGDATVHDIHKRIMAAKAGNELEFL
jgi:hypothetical protein